MEPERWWPAAVFHLGNTLVDKRESRRCLISDLYYEKASTFEMRRHLISAGKETLLGCRGPGRRVLWLFSAGRKYVEQNERCSRLQNLGDVGIE